MGFSRGNQYKVADGDNLNLATQKDLAQELGNVAHHATFDQLSLNKLYSLASVPEEVKEFNIVVRDGHLTTL